MHIKSDDNRIIRYTILLILTAAVFGVCGILTYMNASAPESIGYYEYPDVSDLYDSQGVKKCRIPEETLEQMTDEELAQAVADYPYLTFVLLSSSSESMSETFAEDCNAYKELLTRKKGLQALSDKADELLEAGEDSIADCLFLLLEYASPLETSAIITPFSCSI